MCTSTAVITSSFAFLLSCKAPVFVLHFSLAAFLQHLEDTLSGARIGRRSGENGITQMVHAGGAVVRPGDLHCDRTEGSRGIARAEDVFLSETVPFDGRKDSH